MPSFFKNNQIKKLEKKHAKLLEEAMQAQRRGDIQGYAKLTAEAEEVYQQIQGMGSEES